MTLIEDVRDRRIGFDPDDGLGPIGPGVDARAPRRAAPRRRWLWVAVLGAILAAVWVAEIGRDEILNPGGWPQVREFFGAALHPELSGAFLRIVWESTLVTLAYAVLGTALALVIGFTLALVVSDAWSRGAPPGRTVRILRGFTRIGLVPMRAVHEAVWAVLLVQVLGINPLVAILAIGVPFGAVTAKVFAQMFDDVNARGFSALRRAGARRRQAMLYGLLPEVGPNLVAYGCYRFECAIRAAAVLGVIGAGGLGFQIKISFQSLNYGEMWTLLYVVILLCAVADFWSSRMRARWRLGSPGIVRRSRSLVARGMRLAALASVPIAWWYLEVDPSTLWAERARENFGRLVTSLFPPVPANGWGTLVELSIDTLAMSVIAIAIAFVGGFGLALLAARPAAGAGLGVRTRSLFVRGMLLVARAIPPPVWAFVFLFVFFPGVVPGALALGVYNLGVLGRLMAELAENADPRPAQTLRASGARAGQVFWYDRLPRLGTGFASLGVYRWEVAIRETVVVGLVAAGGLGAALGQELAAFDYQAISATLLALVLITAFTDVISERLRRSLR